MACIERNPDDSRECLCMGGPYDDKYIFLTTDRTMPFKVNGYHGYYMTNTHHSNKAKWFNL